VSYPPTAHFRPMFRPVPRRATLIVVGVLVVIAWVVVDVSLWPVGLAAGVILACGVAQLVGVVPAF
jgi:hypothetical protein